MDTARRALVTTAAAVAVVGIMKRLMNVPNEMDQKAQSLGTHWRGKLTIPHDPGIAFDLRNDAIISLAIAPPVVSSGLDRYVDEMPWRGIRPLPPNFIGPC